MLTNLSKAIRIVHFLIVGILLTFSLSGYAQITPLACDSSSTVSLKNRDIYKLITAGQENEIKKYFSSVSLEELVRSDSGVIAKAFKRINTNDKITRTIWILEELKNRNFKIRAFVYNELLKADFGKPSFFLNHMINNYFTNYSENEITLKEKVRKLHGKMNRKF